MRATRSSLVPVVLAALLLSGCASGGDAGFCGPLHENSELAASVFAPLVPGADAAAQVQERLDMVERLEPAPDLKDELQTWSEYLSAASAALDDPAAALAAYDADAQAAGIALLEYYTGTCLR